VTGLAKRLLLGRTASDDAELGMVDRLKKGESYPPFQATPFSSDG